MLLISCTPPFGRTQHLDTPTSPLRGARALETRYLTFSLAKHKYKVYSSVSFSLKRENIEIMPLHFVRIKGLRGYPAKKIEMLFPFLSKDIIKNQSLK